MIKLKHYSLDYEYIWFTLHDSHFITGENCGKLMESSNTWKSEIREPEYSDDK